MATLYTRAFQFSFLPPQAAENKGRSKDTSRDGKGRPALCHPTFDQNWKALRYTRNHLAEFHVYDTIVQDDTRNQPELRQ